MNILVVLFFNNWEAFVNAAGENLPTLRHYVTQARVHESSPVADHFALVLGRHNGRGVSRPSDVSINNIVSTKFRFNSRAIVALSGEAFNDLQVFKPSVDPTDPSSGDPFKEGAIALLANTPPIFTGDLHATLYRTMCNAPERIRNND